MRVIFAPTFEADFALVSFKNDLKQGATKTCRFGYESLAGDTAVCSPE